MENTNTIKVEEMDCWAADDWAAFGVGLWELRGQIVADPAYIAEAVDILVGLRKALPELNLAMKKYACDLADDIALLCCERINSLVGDCRWDARQASQSYTAPSAPDDTPPDGGDDLGLPREWFDVLGDDDDDD